MCTVVPLAWKRYLDWLGNVFWILNYFPDFTSGSDILAGLRRWSVVRVAAEMNTLLLEHVLSPLCAAIEMLINWEKGFSRQEVLKWTPQVTHWQLKDKKITNNIRDKAEAFLQLTQQKVGVFLLQTLSIGQQNAISLTPRQLILFILFWLTPLITF